MPKNRRGGGGGRGGGRGGGHSGNQGGGGGHFRDNLRGPMKIALQEQINKLRDGSYSTNLNMFRDKVHGPANQVDVYLKGTVNLLGDLRALTTLKIDQTSFVKAVANESAMRDIHLVDLKLNVQGPAEDEIYAMYPLLIKNIRRGNTVLRIDSP